MIATDKSQDSVSKLANPYKQRIGLRPSSDASEVLLVEREFDESVRALSDDIDQMYETWDAYTNLEQSQWEKQKLMQLKTEERTARSYDIISPKVDTLAGALISEMPDVDWLPVEGERTVLTDAVRDTWYSDKELTNSEYEIILAVRDGLVHSGWLQLTETYKYGKPTLGVQRVMPGYLIPSSYWTQESDRHMECCFRIAYLTPEQMIRKYKTREGDIAMAAEIIKRQGHEELPSNAYTLRRRYQNRIADHYKVIEKHYLDFVTTERLVGPRIETHPDGTPTGNVRWVPFPVTQNRQVLEGFAARQGIDWEHVQETKYDDVIHKVKAIAPELSRHILLEDGVSKIQVKGLPFYNFTVMRYNGRNKGIVAAMIDPQRTINERESLVTELISKANGGSQLVDENIFSDDESRDRFTRNANKPGYKHFVDFSQTNMANPVVQVGSAQYPSQVLDQIGRMYDKVIPMVSRVSDSMSAVSGNSNKSGVLFEREIQINQIGNLLMSKGINRMMNDFAEGYFYQWQLTYAGVPREVTKRDGKTKTTLNERFFDDQGREFVRNVVGYVPRCRVQITENQTSQTKQMRKRLIFGDLLPQINPEVTPEYYLYIVNQFIHTLDLSDEEKGELEKIKKQIEVKSQMQYMSQLTQINAQTKQGTLMSAQADIQLQQIMVQMQQMQQQMGMQQQVPQAQQATPQGLDDAVPADEVDQSTQPAAGSDLADNVI